ncbi:succinyl-diaminopimelate desuccinylase [Robiginitomaculum antarcticum]|uniref:succinyl-diaminopimelate desuccinylase n=1 Tax=Robiginitomaculum antarcticum TaxID=437507 RepID=UPI000364747B|nr:succinyl-diaminopimelate desuccinylase [Robiginitomaculum antarcticum]
MTFETIDFAARLIRCASVTPLDAGALDILQTELETLGFVCTRYPFGAGKDRVDNLYARLGTTAPNFCFAGHTDVVPQGEASDWSAPAFAGQVKDGALWGRGAADMKGGIAAMVGAIADLRAGGWIPEGSISFLITGDEEGPAINGTEKLLKAITDAGEVIDHCLVGEPTNPTQLGQHIKNGRRGSLNAKITVTGTEGHVAYPNLANNPVPALMELLTRLTKRKLDRGNKFFQPSNLEVTTIDIGNPAHNVIPKIARAQFNIRFNTEHHGDDLKAWIIDEVAHVEDDYDCKIDPNLRVTGEAFLTKPCGFTEILLDSAEHILGVRPELSTAGGTSDARYITNYAPVAEFGLIGATMHKVDEHVAVSDIMTLQCIYSDVLTRYFAQ